MEATSTANSYARLVAAARPAVLERAVADIAINTRRGEIDLGVPLRVMRSDGSSVLGRIGDGAGRIDIKTRSGDVRLVGH